MGQDVSRRRFIGAAVGTGALAMAGAGTQIARADTTIPPVGDGKHRIPRNRRGIQLYTMRQKMRNKDQARSVLRWLGRAGFTEVQLAGHYGWTAAELKRELDFAGLRAFAGHDDPDILGTNWQDGYKASCQYAAELGQEYTALAYYFTPSYETLDYSALAVKLNEAGEIAKSFGLKFFYHNHDWEFKVKFKGADAFQTLLNETDRKLVRFELDLFWINQGGGNAVNYLRADPERFFSYHVKDHVWGNRPTTSTPRYAVSQDYEDLGVGMFDFPDLFRAGDPDNKLDKHFVFEHDSPWLSHPNDPQDAFKSASAAIAYYDTIRW